MKCNTQEETKDSLFITAVFFPVTPFDLLFSLQYCVDLPFTSVILRLTLRLNLVSVEDVQRNLDLTILKGPCNMRVKSRK